METSRDKICPISKELCLCELCSWWCNFGHDCAVPLIAGILADSEINRVKWGGNDDAAF